MLFSSDFVTDFYRFLDPLTPQNIEKRIGGPSKINEVEFSFMVMRLNEKSTSNKPEIGPEIGPNRHQNVIAKNLKKMS